MKMYLEKRKLEDEDILKTLGGEQAAILKDVVLNVEKEIDKANSTLYHGTDDAQQRLEEIYKEIEENVAYGKEVIEDEDFNHHYGPKGNFTSLEEMFEKEQ